MFYDGKKIAQFTDAELEHLSAYGFVKKDDGSIWINEGSLANNTLDFNKLFFHEFAHSNGLNEVQANYIEQSYGQFLDEVNANGYITADGKISNWKENTLSFSNLMTLLTVTPDGIEMKPFEDKKPSNGMFAILEDIKRKSDYSKISLRGDYQGIVLSDGTHVLISLNAFELNKEDGSIKGDLEGIEYNELKNLFYEDSLKFYAGRNGKDDNIDPNKADGANSFTRPTSNIYGISYSEIDKQQYELDKTSNKEELKGTAIILSIWSGGEIIRGLDFLGTAIAGTGKLVTTLYYSTKAGYKGYLIYTGVTGTVNSTIGAYDAFSEGRYWAGTLEVGKGLLNIYTVVSSASGMRTDVKDFSSALSGAQKSVVNNLTSNIINNGKNSSTQAILEGRAGEKETLLKLGLEKNNEVWRPTETEMNSSLFKIIVGEKKYTKTGLPVGTIIDSTTKGLYEIKKGSSILSSSYQLRLQLFRAVSTGQEYTLASSRPLTNTYSNTLNFWGVNRVNLK